MAMAEYDKVTRRDRYEYAGALERLTGAVNEVLRDAMHNGEWSDSLPQAVEWLEHEHMAYLQRMDFDTQVDFYKTALFQSILRLYCMTHGDGYSDDTMNAVCQELSDMAPCIAARKTAELVTLISGEDMVRHGRRGEASRAEALWSGSVAGQLQQLVQPRQLTYAANKPRHSEWLQRMQYPSE